MWRRSEVLTDLEFYELRYSGQAARVVRGFRAVYLGLVFNAIIMATVNLAACKIAAVLFGLERWQTLLLVGSVNVVFAAYAGLWGVLVIDMIQFVVKMTAVIAAAWFALQAPGVGGLDGLITQLSAQRGPGGLDYLRILPDFSNQWDLAVAVFLMPIAVQWWAVWYPGAEPGGGSYVAQRMLASKSEKDALARCALLQRRALRAAAVAVDPRRPRLADRLPHPRRPGPRRAARRSTAHRPRPGLSGDAALPPGRLRRADGGRTRRRQLVDDPHALELGGVVPGARPLPPLHQHHRSRGALRPRGARRHGGAVRDLVGGGLRPRHGEERLRHHPAGRRRHRPPLPGALVLVARRTRGAKSSRWSARWPCRWCC